MADRSRTIECPSCHAAVPLPKGSRWRGWRLVLIVAGVLGLALAALVYRYLGQVRTLVMTINEVTGSTGWSWVLLLAAMFVVLCLLAWLVLPILFAAMYLDLRRRGRNWLGSDRSCR